ALPNVSARLLYVEPGASAAFALRRAIVHLRNGKALLHFPAGDIERDPALSHFNGEPISKWEPGVEVMLAAGALFGLNVAVALVQGVIAPRARALAKAIAPTAEATDAIVPLLQLTFAAVNDARPALDFGLIHPAGETSAQDLRAELVALASARAR